jgi:ribonuclease HI
MNLLTQQPHVPHCVLRKKYPEKKAGYFKTGTNPERLDLSDFIAYVDGGSHGSPGPSGIGVLIEKPDGEMIRIAKWIGHHDNNVAEYAALLEALQRAVDLNATSLSVYTDSELVVKQMTGEYSCRSPRLYSLNWMCRKLARTLKFCISHIPREQNQEANRLANHAVRFRREPLLAEVE